jgi:hypothetical protein
VLYYKNRGGATAPPIFTYKKKGFTMSETKPLESTSQECPVLRSTCATWHEKSY